MITGSHKPSVLMVNPWIFDFKAFDLWMKPLGLLFISSILRQNGWQVTLIDCLDRHHPSVRDGMKFRDTGTGKFATTQVEKPDTYRAIPRRYKRYGIPPNAFAADVAKAPRPDVIMVTSSMTYWYPGPHMAISLLREAFPGVPVLLGGTYATLCTGFARQHSGASLIVPGSDTQQILSALEEAAGVSLSIRPESFQSFPPPDYSHYPGLSSVALITSVGCPFRCTYCASGILQGNFLAKSPDRAAGEIAQIARDYGVKRFAFYDDALLSGPENRIKPLLRKIIQNHGDSLSFYTPNGLHAGLIDGETARLFKQSGFRQICLGLETTEPSVMEKTGGKVKGGDLEAAVGHLFAAGFTAGEIAVYTMMGLPGQTPAQVESTLDTLFRLGVQNRLSTFSPVPGTPDFDRIKDRFPGGLSEPLLHNNACHFYLGAWEDFPTRKYLKDKAVCLTRQVLKTKTPLAP